MSDPLEDLREENEALKAQLARFKAEREPTRKTTRWLAGLLIKIGLGRNLEHHVWRALSTWTEWRPRDDVPRSA